MDITQAQVRALFEYRDGHLYRRVTVKHNAKGGDRAGWSHGQGRFRVRINRKSYYLHRVIYLYHHGVMPDEIDHIDGNPSNNRIENLRAATHQENQANHGVRSDNKLGIKGVRVVANGKYVARLKQRHLGTFDSAEQAAKAYNLAAQKKYNEFAWLNDV